MRDLGPGDDFHVRCGAVADEVRRPLGVIRLHGDHHVLQRARGEVTVDEERQLRVDREEEERQRARRLRPRVAASVAVATATAAIAATSSTTRATRATRASTTTTATAAPTATAATGGVGHCGLKRVAQGRRVDVCAMLRLVPAWCMVRGARCMVQGACACAAWSCAAESARERRAAPIRRMQPDERMVVVELWPHHQDSGHLLTARRVRAVELEDGHRRVAERRRVRHRELWVFRHREPVRREREVLLRLAQREQLRRSATGEGRGGA